MEEKNGSKLFVFDKIEVILIFVFIIIIASTSFILGVRVGKELSLKSDQYTEMDKKTIDLKSVDEEYVDTIIKDKKADDSPSEFEDSIDSSKPDKKMKDDLSMEQRLKEEMEKLATDNIDVKKPVVNEKPSIDDQVSETNSEAKTISTTDDLYAPKREYKGKYTIQLYANQSKSSAQDFADGFILKGYDVIINEVDIAGKGIFYRVSIGIFNTFNGAKDYLEKESKLFQGKEYLIKQF